MHFVCYLIICSALCIYVVILIDLSTYFCYTGKPDLPLLELPGLSILNCFYDWMHCAHLGLYQMILGSVMHLLVHKHLPSDPMANLTVVWKKMCKYYSDHPGCAKYSRMKLSMFSSPKDSGPKLRGKAAVIRAHCKILYLIWKELMSQADQTHKEVLVLLKSMCILEDVLHDYKTHYVLPAQIAKQFDKACVCVLQLCQSLSYKFAVGGEKCFTLTKKGHFLAHLSANSHLLNPSLVWCYRGEDFMSTMRTLMEACVKGVGPSGTSKKVAARIRVGMHFELLGL